MNKLLDILASEAYMTGRKDYEANGENFSNPYKPKTEQALCWDKGYNDARSAQALDEQNSWFG